MAVEASFLGAPAGFIDVGQMGAIGLSECLSGNVGNCMTLKTRSGREI